jgi:hypothetical protein
MPARVRGSIDQIRTRLTRRRLFLLLVVCTVTVIGCCLRPDRSQGQTVALQIELDAFSGQPNPLWTLTDEQAANFIARFKVLQPIQVTQSSANGLGYRGFIVRQVGGSLNGYDEMRIFRGTVVVRRSGDITAFSDKDAILERQLIESARSHVPEAVLQFIEREIAR